MHVSYRYIDDTYILQCIYTCVCMFIFIFISIYIYIHIHVPPGAQFQRICMPIHAHDSDDCNWVSSSLPSCPSAATTAPISFPRVSERRWMSSKSELCRHGNSIPDVRQLLKIPKNQARLLWCDISDIWKKICQSPFFPFFPLNKTNIITSPPLFWSSWPGRP